ncbi:MAG: phosphate propanoyltransferase [Oscillospiraceae bacterium]
MNRIGLVQIEVSARHIHLSEDDVEILFGKGYKLTPKRELSQPGQFLCEERVNLIGTKGGKKNVAILGPVRPNTQVELSQSDCIELGVLAPLRESGDTKFSGQITIEGAKGTVKLIEGVIIAKAHIHMPPKIARELGVKDKQQVMVEAFTDRPVIYKDVLVRVSDKFSYRMHIDFDEANCAAVGKFTLGRILAETEEKDRYDGFATGQRVYEKDRSITANNLYAVN